MVCMVFLKCLFFTSLSNSARIIGAGNENASSNTLIMIVFLIRRTAYMLLKNALKCLRPTQLLPNNPFAGR